MAGARRAAPRQIQAPMRDWYKSCGDPACGPILANRSCSVTRVIIVAILSVIASSAQAHEGALSPDGCHDDLLAGSFHCHGTQTIVAAGVPAPPLSPAAIETRNPQAPQSNFTAKTIEDDQVFAAQTVLQKNGCYDGRLAGVLGPGTVYAIKLFEANMGLAITGALDGEPPSALRQSHNRFDICR